MSKLSSGPDSDQANSLSPMGESFPLCNVLFKMAQTHRAEQYWGGGWEESRQGRFSEAGENWARFGGSFGTKLNWVGGEEVEASQGWPTGSAMQEA